jgi:glucose-6-phosphate isomerase
MNAYLDPKWQKSMRLEFDFNHMTWAYAAQARKAIAETLVQEKAKFDEKEQALMQQSIDKLTTPDEQALKKNFVTDEELSQMREAALQAFDQVQAGKGSAEKMMAWTTLPFCQQQVVQALNDKAQQIRSQFDAFVVLGIGGSALGPIAVQQALNDLHYNELPRQQRGGPKLYVEDNVDPERMASLINVLDLDKTCFNVISKSGNTSETMSQYLIVSDLLKQRFGKDYAKHMVITTDAQKGNLRKIAQADGVDTFAVPDGVGGRFSELCPVGLLAAAVCGADIAQLLAGAAYMDEICQARDPEKNPALFGAVMMKLAMDKGMNISVMMPYADSLKYFSDWYAQLWAESLGKNRLITGEPCAVGQTPVKAVGVTDQHSQVQLYTEGPNDKLITFLAVSQYRANVTISEGCAQSPDVHFLCGHTLNELIDAERKATQYALLKSAKPSYTITLKQVNEFTLGQLMYYLEMMTAYCGSLLGIDAFDQPGVEEGKNAAYAMLGRPGYAYKEKELGASIPPIARYQF